MSHSCPGCVPHSFSFCVSNRSTKKASEAHNMQVSAKPVNLWQYKARGPPESCLPACLHTHTHLVNVAQGGLAFLLHAPQHLVHRAIYHARHRTAT